MNGMNNTEFKNDSKRWIHMNCW